MVKKNDLFEHKIRVRKIGFCRNLKLNFHYKEVIKRMYNFHNL